MKEMYIYTFSGFVFRVRMTTVSVKDLGESYYYKSKLIFIFLTKQFIDGLESRSNWKTLKVI